MRLGVLALAFAAGRATSVRVAQSGPRRIAGGTLPGRAALPHGTHRCGRRDHRGARPARLLALARRIARRRSVRGEPRKGFSRGRASDVTERLLPLFPLPLVLFPGVLLPLHLRAAISGDARRLPCRRPPSRNRFSGKRIPTGRSVCGRVRRRHPEQRDASRWTVEHHRRRRGSVRDRAIRDWDTSLSPRRSRHLRGRRGAARAARLTGAAAARDLRARGSRGARAC